MPRAAAKQATRKKNENPVHRRRDNKRTPSTVKFRAPIGGKRLSRIYPLSLNIKQKIQIKKLLNEMAYNEMTRFGLRRRRKLVRYNMGGKQKAATKIFNSEGTEIETFETKNNMHSEMMALDYGLNELGFQVEENGLINTKDYKMKTNVPHCRFCSFFLGLLGVERTNPSTGNHLFARNGTYPIPKEIKYNRSVLENAAKHLGFNTFDEAVASVLPQQTDPETKEVFKIAFDYCDEVCRDKIADSFWSNVFNILYNAK